MNIENSQPIRPQNPSRPAGGASAANDNHSPTSGSGKRGVIVAPTSGNTDNSDLPIVLHVGFDTLALAIKANIPDDLFERLDAEQKIASDERREVVVILEGVTFVTVCSPRNRQVIIYNKRAEVIEHNKSYWWPIPNARPSNCKTQRTGMCSSRSASRLRNVT